MNLNDKGKEKDEIKKKIMSNFDGWMLIDIVEVLEELMRENRLKASQAALRIKNERNS